MVSRKFKPLLCASMLALTGLASPAQAQPTEVEVPADTAWEHQWTNMAFPPNFGPFARTRINAFEEQETNIAASYRDDTTGTVLTIYIYRPGNPSTAIWFDRALIAIGASNEQVDNAFGEVDLEDLKIGRFVPAGGSAQSGLSAVLEVEGQSIQSTGVALYRAGQWLVKVRISSAGMDVPQLDLFLKQTLNELPEMAEVDPNAVPFIASCTGDAPASDGDAIEGDILGMLAVSQAASLMAEQMPPDEDADTAEGAQALNPADFPYCRDGARSRQVNFYRSTGDDGRLVVAAGDSGFSIDVYRDEVGSVLSDDSRPIYAVRTASGIEYTLFQPYFGMPSAQQIVDSINGAYVAKVSRPLEEGDGGSISIGAGAGLESD